ncbi:MAG: CPBP family intramembrane metalloprotease [Lachnospiraceae bacterium]|nr:CPBP family intramembrane metalloprotease [Lachnospiraceae bacterium]
MPGNAEKKYVRKTNNLFLILILLYLALEFFVTLITGRDIEFGITASLILSQGSLILPALIFIAAERLDIKEWAPFKKIRWSTFGLTILFTLCISPFVTLINLLSQLFTTNFVAELAEELFSEPPLLMMVMIGVIGPFCEEFTFRGVIFHGLRKSGRVLAAIIVSALFFGLMHMNLNQFCYAFFLGIAFALLTEATGSLIPPITMHLCINSSNIGMEFIADFLYSSFNGGSEGLAELFSESEVTRDEIFYIAGIYMIPGLIGLALSIVVFIAICRNEGSLEHIKSLFTKKSTKAAGPALATDIPAEAAGPAVTPDMPAVSAGSDVPYGDIHSEDPQIPAIQKKTPVITASGWIAIVFCVIVILASDVVLRLVGNW